MTDPLDLVIAHVAAVTGTDAGAVTSAEDDSPLAGVVWARDGHSWLFATAGLAVATGTELTMAVPADDDEPPWWPIAMLDELVGYIEATGNAVEAGDAVPMHAPIVDGSVLTALLAAPDPRLSPVGTTEVAYTRLVGVSDAELELARDWDVQQFCDALGDALTDPTRADRGSDPALVSTASAGSARDGSSTGAAFVGELSITVDGELVAIDLPAIALPSLRRGLLRRIPFGRDFWVQGPAVALELVPSAVPGVERGKGVVRLGLTDGAAAHLATALVAGADTVHIHELPTLTVRIVPTRVYDGDGRLVREVR